MIVEGTHERNQQEEFQLQICKERFANGMDFWTDGNLDCAMREFSVSLEIREDICGRKDLETARSYLWKGTIHFLQEDYERALDDFYRCFRIQYEIKGMKDGCHVVINWINKSVDALNLKQTKALLWQKFMTCIEQEQKGDSYKGCQKYEKAIESYRSALEFEYQRRHLNPHTPGRPLSDCGDLYFKIGRCYQLNNDFGRAVMEYREAFSIYLAKFGCGHRHTAVTRGRIMEVFSEIGFHESVVEAFVERLPEAMRHEQSGDWNINVNKDIDGALNDYKAALEIEGQHVGMSQVACAVLQYKMAKIHILKQDIHSALFLACRAIGTLEAILGPQHKLTAAAVKLIKTMNQTVTSS